MTAGTSAETTPETTRGRDELPTQYVPGDVEAEIYERWQREQVFRADPASARPPYCIVIPPPNVTGSLHIGHAFEHTLIDALIRWRHLEGDETLWLPGTDHAGIATQNVVERELAGERVSRHELGRAAFVERVWLWREESGGQILRQMRRLGDAVDWSRERFTMDQGLSRAVLTIFKRLFDDGLIYRAERIINWCPRCLTALSDIEVEHSDDEGELVFLRYGPLTVATTRVETMLGDTAVAVHPDDDRYRHLVGTTVELPLTGRRIPVIADDAVDPEFGTGAVKVTPAHDPNDFEIGQRHGLPAVTVMDERGTITVPGPFGGLDRYEARPAITAALRELGLVAEERRPYVHAVGHCSRCRTVVEPRLSLQWFVRVGPLAAAAGAAVRDGRVRIHPPEMTQRFFDWVDSMHDWCISRQLWWGHRIPVWYGPNGEQVAVGPDEDPPRGEGWSQDEDVLDTWFSSALWPFSTLGWPDRTKDLERFYPTSVLVTGYDILFFWVTRMMMFGLYAMDGLEPFRVVALHGMVRDARGRKMSKSFGNVVDPLEWIDRYGADALRFTLARGANPGVDVPIGEEWVQASRNFVNKIWNATRFALLAGARHDLALPDPAELAPADRWILSRLQAVAAGVRADLAAFEFAKVCETLYHFAWDEVFDWYVELAKVPLASGGAAAQATRAVLGHLIETLLRLLHPIAPFVTERLWTELTGRTTILAAGWPIADPTRVDPEAEVELAALREVVTEVRRFRADQRIRPSVMLPAVIVADDGLLTRHSAQIAALARLSGLAVGTAPDGWITVTVGGCRLALDVAGVIDIAAECARLQRDRLAAEKRRAQDTAKLATPAFVAKAPEPVVAAVRERLAAAEADLRRIAEQRAALGCP